MSSSSIEITPELLAGFLDEAPEYLEMLDTGLMEFEAQVGSNPIRIETPEDRDRMNTMFRAAHSLKGLAAAFGFDRIKELTHRMETFFDGLRMNQRTLASDGVDTLFQVFDRLRLLVQELSEETEEPVAIDDLLAGLDGMLNADASGESASTETASTQTVFTDRVTEKVTSAVSDEKQNTATEATEGCGSTLADEAFEEPCPVEDDLALNEVFGDPELAAIFLETTCETIDELNQGLLGLEESPNDSELLNKAFRCAHNIKGASGAAGLRGMNRLTHSMETMFDQLRSGRISLDEEIMNACFTVVDRLKDVLDRIREGRIEDVGPNELCDVFSKWSSPAATSGVAPKQATEAQGGQGDDVSAGLDEDSLPPPYAESDEHFGEKRHLLVTVEFEEGFGEAAIQTYLIHNKLSGLGQVVSTDPDLDAIAGDTLVTKISFVVHTDIASADVEGFVKAYTVKGVTVAPCDQAVLKGGETPSIAVPQQDVSPREPIRLATKSPESVAPMQSQRAAGASPVAKTKSSPASKMTAPGAKAIKPGAPTPKRLPKGAKSDAPTTKTTETLRVDQDRLDHLMNLGGELVINRARFVQIHRNFREVFDGKNLGYLVDDIGERLSQLGSHVERMTDGERGDSVGEFASEIAHLRTSIAPICSLVGQVHALRTSMVDFDEALHALTRVSESIQKGIMGTRMVPIGPLFNRFRRVVRDIAKSNGKKIELVLCGETTELDKRMIDELGDPLTHMVRNSVDHGIETVAARKAAGKNPVGTLTLSAYHRGNSICIEVTDDGAGINIEKVKAKILEKELATPQKVEAMSDRELIQYVFQAGFSTAEKVTDVSGRGMGMDIVVNKIEKLNGTIEMESTWGKGTRVIVKLPLTLAILTSLVARIGKGVYAIPLETVSEIITVQRKDIQFIQKREVVRVRDRVVPIARFEDVFATELESLKTKTRDNDELTLVIVGYENSKIGLLVDELLGQDDVVIKSIAENYRNVKGIAGASIRGDGSVSLILDIGAMMGMAAKASDRTASTKTLVGV